MSKFSESFERLQNGTATEEEAAFVREEIEKHETIEGYLSAELDQMLPIDTETADASIGKNIAKKVHFRIAGTVLVILLILGAAAGIGVAICNEYYYDPNEGIETDFGDNGQFLIDMWALSELHFPEYNTNGARAWRDGPGTYELRIYQNHSFTGEFVEASERIVRGKVVAAEPFSSKNYMKLPPWDAFGYREGRMSWSDEEGTHWEPYPEKLSGQLEALRELPQSCRASVYVTFAEDLSLEEFAALREAWLDDIIFPYVAVASAEAYIRDTLGFSVDRGGIVLENTPEEYPHFQISGYYDGSEGNLPTLWEQHFRSVLSYLAGRTEFVNAMGSPRGTGCEQYQEALDYIDENGVKTYGALVFGDADKMVAFLESIDPWDFYVNDVQLSILARR